MTERDVRDRLAHILEAITAIDDYTIGKNREQYLADRLLVDAVERNIERLSEAARHLPAKLKDSHPEIPWRQVADAGNVLRHAYDRVLDDLIWQIIEHDLAPLKSAVEAMIDELEEGPGP